MIQRHSPSADIWNKTEIIRDKIKDNFFRYIVIPSFPDIKEFFKGCRQCDHWKNDGLCHLHKSPTLSASSLPALVEAFEGGKNGLWSIAHKNCQRKSLDINPPLYLCYCSTLHFKLGLTNATLFLNVVSVHLKTSGNSDEIKVNFGEK